MYLGASAAVSAFAKEFTLRKKARGAARGGGGQRGAEGSWDGLGEKRGAGTG